MRIKESFSTQSNPELDIWYKDKVNELTKFFVSKLREEQSFNLTEPIQLSFFNVNELEVIAR